MTAPIRYTRVIAFVLILVLAIISSACDQQDKPKLQVEKRPVAHEQNDGVIVAMGDSLTAGLGVAPEHSYPAVLESFLQMRGYDYMVINSGVSGETTSGAKARMSWVLKLKPDIVILESGANDGLRGIDPAIIEKNLSAIIESFIAQNVVVVFTGMKMVGNLGPAYVADFDKLYQEVADKYPVVFMPFFLGDIAAVPELNQEDGIHPNSEGYRVLAANLLPYVEEAIKRHQGNKAVPAVGQD